MAFTKFVALLALLFTFLTFTTPTFSAAIPVSTSITVSAGSAVVSPFQNTTDKVLDGGMLESRNPDGPGQHDVSSQEFNIVALMSKGLPCLLRQNRILTLCTTVWKFSFSTALPKEFCWRNRSRRSCCVFTTCRVGWDWLVDLRSGIKHTEARL